ncbi:GreA/GreB family elongation factor [Sediminibacterium ginsengisoli]|uniref:Regulator of nucleoside diphosphate kinase n=1 Tax=Sediminibacterium ginsengisoli TaxID=413434 RepID=A0A1T4L6Y8_9BACT|nr:GreA/GreB family elongation factor [Sediminibacterium ginsengisoli]SJZ50403.1 regulator of nucleoside diphosphate kinase [Sediminibacterium ginsengisoli]
MQNENNELMITPEDFDVISTYIKRQTQTTVADRQNAVMLQEELKKAKLVKAQELPADVVRINSTVRIKEGEKDKLIELTLVLPEKADIKSRKVSVFAPIAIALIGFKKGAKVNWQVPAGNKTFTIVDVCNQPENVAEQA